MRKTIFTPIQHLGRKLQATALTLMLIFAAAGLQTADAQCALACNKSTQVSLDEYCEAEVTPAMIINADTTICPRGRFEVIVSYHGRPIPTSPIVTCANIGQKLEVMVRDTSVRNGNSCWGEITVEDKLAPVIECGEDTLFCYQMPKYTGPKVTDNCKRAAYVYDFSIRQNVHRVSMDSVFGSGNWDEFDLTTNPAPHDVFSCKYDVIYLNVLDGTRDYQNYKDALEQWVNDGGSVFFHAAFDDGGYEIGFGGIRLERRGIRLGAIVQDPDHPIFEGPFCPARFDSINGGGPGTRNSIADAHIIGPAGLNSILKTFRDDTTDVMVETNYGQGHIVVSTLYGWGRDRRAFVFPEEEYYNVNLNILHYLRDISPNKVEMILEKEEVFPQGCSDSVFVKIVEREYYARDESGNVSTTCKQRLYLKRFPVDTASIDCPPEYTLAEGNAVQCDDVETGVIPTLANGAPTPEWAGVPQVDGIDLWPPNDFYCNVTVSYEDIVLPKVGCVTKIMRMWTVSEWWCSREIEVNCRQLIEIVDTIAPTIVKPDDISTTTSGGYECEADITLPYPQTSDICGSVVRVDVKYPGGFIKEMARAQTVQLPVGDSLEVIYYAYDDCYNIDSAIVYVTVEDLTPPVAVCDRYTVVGLTYDSVAHVYAETFDDATYDDCKIDSFAVRRMDGGSNCGRVDVGFKSYVEFCCEDINPDTNVMVIFRAYDKSGNFNDCMVEVEVQDKILPHIYCPPDITISCDYHFDLSDLGATFGRVVTDKSLRQPIVIDDDSSSIDGPALDGHAYDNCSVTVTEDTTMNITQCNVGTITRTFTATDRNGSVSCTQTITIENFHEFDSLDITWPAPFDTIGCIDPDNLDEEVTGTPIFNEDECDLVGYSFEDHVFPFFNAQQACLKIIRKWKVIDWCAFEYNPRTGGYEYDTYTYEQVIKVNDTLDPFFVSVTPDSMFCSFDSTCISGPADLIATAGDSCTPGAELRWEYKIDFDNNGVYDTTATGLGDTIDASGEYRFGDHRIKYTFEDRCGNKITTERLFSIINCKAPSPYCKNGIVVDLMPMDLDRDGIPDTAMIEIWASDLDLGSEGACDNPVIISFSDDPNDKNRSYNCDSLGQRNVEIWVTDSITGTQAFCRTFVIIQDNNDVCDTMTLTGGRVSGLIQTEDKENVIDAQVDLDGSTFTSQMTNDLGQYAFPMMPFGGRYFVNPKKDDMHLDGISTKDLIIIQRHLLGITSINTPYKLIAADVNNDTEISVNDISQLRKLILGVYNELPDNTAWRFVDEDYTFPNPDDPFTPAFPEQYSIDQFTNTMTDVNFVALKVGDVDNSVDPSGVNQNGTRNNNTLEIEIANVEWQGGQPANIEFKAKDLENILGYQFTLNFDAQMLEFVDVIGGVCDVDASNIGLTYLEDGMINVSWNQSQAVQLSPNDVLFTVQFVGLQAGEAKDAISINSRMTRAEAYDGDANEMDLRLNVNGQEGPQVSFRLYQNHPNPFNDNTVIGFDLPQDGKAMLTIYDVTGKVVALYELEGYRGYNSMEIISKDLTSTGVLYYQLDTQGFTATKKMVVLQ